MRRQRRIYFAGEGNNVPVLRTSGDDIADVFSGVVRDRESLSLITGIVEVRDNPPHYTGDPQAYDPRPYRDSVTEVMS